MPEHASRFIGLYDQQNENRIPDWGGDELFTRMPSPPAVDDAPAPRFRPSLVVVDGHQDQRRALPAEEVSGPRDRRFARPADEAGREPGWADEPVRERADGRPRSAEDAVRERADRRPSSADEAVRERADRLGISVVESDAPPAPEAAEESPRAAAARQWEADHASSGWDGAIEAPPERAANGRRTTLITGRPEGAPRPLSLVPPERRRPRRTPAELIGARPERIVAWAFVLGLLLILIAISTADAATL
jgi:hypothetical protein